MSFTFNMDPGIFKVSFIDCFPLNLSRFRIFVVQNSFLELISVSVLYLEVGL